MSTTSSGEGGGTMMVTNAKDSKTNLEVPFIISSNEDTMVSAVIAKMALQIFGWKDMSIQNAYNVAIDSLKQAEDFFKALEKKGYVKRKNGKIVWQEK